MLVLGIFTHLLSHYRKKWADEKIDLKYKQWEDGQEMRKDYGYDDKTVERIPKRKIRSKAARRKHGY